MWAFLGSSFRTATTYSSIPSYLTLRYDIIMHNCEAWQGVVSNAEDVLQRHHLLLCVASRLVEQFGSTRRKRQMTAKELAAVNPDSIRTPLAHL